MKNKILYLIILGLVFSIAYANEVNKALEGMPAGTPIRKIRVTAEKFKFTPEEIRVRQNTHVILELESLDDTHGFKAKHYGIDVTIPARGKATVEFYTREPGTYPFKCSIFCGLGHFWMDGKIIVEAP